MVCADAVSVTGRTVALTPPVAAVVSVITTVAPTRLAAVGMTTGTVLPHSTESPGTSIVACPKGVTFASKTAMPVTPDAHVLWILRLPAATGVPALVTVTV
jgi:hypothetical protein